MKILDSSIQLLSQRTSINEHQRHESLTTWGPGEEPVTQNINGKNGQLIDLKKEISLFTEAASSITLSEQAKRASKAQGIDEPVSRDSKIMLDLNIRILKAMVERITGKKIDIASFDTLRSTNEVPTVENVVGEPVNSSNESRSIADGRSIGGLAYDYHESYHEYESTSFSSNGTILTEDGKEVEFSVNLNMSREFFSEKSLSIRAGEALKDPLVINFSGKAAELTQKTFSFDIDNDGQENQISFLQPGSGFLALDKNGDNVVNDGSELFGPASGNGFMDLAAHDSDGNNWIDENDSVFHKLRIWTKDAEGNDVLFALGQKGVGAIYLDSAATLFSMKDSENNLLGQVQSTGIFLSENGSVGTMQQVDLVA